MDGKRINALYKEIFVKCYLENYHIEGGRIGGGEMKMLNDMDDFDVYRGITKLLTKLLDFKRSQTRPKTSAQNKEALPEHRRFQDENSALKAINFELNQKISELTEKLSESNSKISQHENSIKKRLIKVIENSKFSFDSTSNEFDNNLVVQSQDFESTKSQKKSQSIKSIKVQLVGSTLKPQSLLSSNQFKKSVHRRYNSEVLLNNFNFPS